MCVDSIKRIFKKRSKENLCLRGACKEWGERDEGLKHFKGLF